VCPFLVCHKKALRRINHRNVSFEVLVFITTKRLINCPVASDFFSFESFCLKVSSVLALICPYKSLHQHSLGDFALILIRVVFLCFSIKDFIK
jgi:hypothetical protein